MLVEFRGIINAHYDKRVSTLCLNDGGHKSVESTLSTNKVTYVDLFIH